MVGHQTLPIENASRASLLQLQYAAEHYHEDKFLLHKYFFSYDFNKKKTLFIEIMNQPMYEGNPESKERLCIQFAHLFFCSRSLVSGVQCDVESLPHAVVRQVP